MILLKYLFMWCKWEKCKGDQFDYEHENLTRNLSCPKAVQHNQKGDTSYQILSGLVLMHKYHLEINKTKLFGFWVTQYILDGMMTCGNQINVLCWN